MYNVLPYDFRCRLGRYALLTGGLLCAALFVGCDSGTAPSLYDPDRSSLPDPVIESIMPEGRALAGVDAVTITGNNFSIQPHENLVYFGTDRGDVLEASATQLRVFAPNNPQPELELRMAVVGAENFSNALPYRLDPPFVEFGDVRDFEDILGIATDSEGNLYASLTAFGSAVGIIRIAPEGDRSDYLSSPFPWADIEFGPDNSLYGVRSVRAVFQSTGEGSDFQVFAVIPNRSTRLTTVTIDANGRIWAAGNNSDIYSIEQDKSVKMHEFEADVQDIALFENFLYVASLQDEISTIWRFPIDANGDLGIPEEIMNITSQSGHTAFALSFSSTGQLYVGTDGTDPVILIQPDGTVAELYPNVLPQVVRRFAWGAGDALYAATNSTEFYPSGIIQIATRQEGNRNF